MIKKLAITGGTHGNELTGIYLVRKWNKNPNLLKRESFETTTRLMNLKAIKEGRRYVDHDLNRSFSLESLANKNPETYEAMLAKEINTLLGEKGSLHPNVEFIVDLHTTTANMGLSIVVSHKSKLTWEAISYLTMMEPELKVYRWQGDEEGAFVDSIAPNGFAIEVGAVPQGVLRADLFLKTEALVYHLLDFIDKYNKNEILNLPKEIEIYDHEKLLDYPRNEEGEIIAMVHQDRQDEDFTLIENGDPLFMTLEEETITYEGETLYTLFINEAAYYEKGFAMTLARNKRINI